MSIPGKLLIALLSALVVSAVAGVFFSNIGFGALFAPSAVSAVLAVILSHRALPMPNGLQPGTESEATPRTVNGQQKSRPGAGGKSRKAKQGGEKKEKPKPRPEDRPTASEGAAALETGTVKWFNGTKGFGFLIRESGEEVFVHHRSIQGEGRRSLRDGASVRFRVVSTEKGPQAEDVEQLS